VTHGCRKTKRDTALRRANGSGHTCDRSKRSNNQTRTFKSQKTDTRNAWSCHPPVRLQIVIVCAEPSRDARFSGPGPSGSEHDADSERFEEPAIKSSVFVVGVMTFGVFGIEP